MEQVHVRKTWITVSNIICFSNTAFGVANSVEQQLQGWGYFVSIASLLEQNGARLCRFSKNKFYVCKT